MFHGTARDAFGRPITGIDRRDAGNPSGVPFGFVTYQVNPGLSVGLAVTSPFGLSTSYGPGFVGRYQGDKTTLQTLDINPAVAVRVAPWLSVGAGVSARYGRTEFSNYVNSSTVAAVALGVPALLPDGYQRFCGDDWAFGYNVGVLVQPGPQTRIGLTYRSRVQEDFSGTADTILPAPLDPGSRLRQIRSSAKVVLPDTAALGITQHLGPDLAVSAEVTWTNWSQFRQLSAFATNGTLLSTAPQHYDNAYFASLGAAWRVREQVTLRIGSAYEKSPVSNAYRSARLPDQDRIWLAVGLSYRVLANATLDAGYAHVFLLNGRVQETSATGDVLTGRFSSHIDLLSVGTRLAF